MLGVRNLAYDMLHGTATKVIGFDPGHDPVKYLEHPLGWREVSNEVLHLRAAPLYTSLHARGHESILGAEMLV